MVNRWLKIFSILTLVAGLLLTWLSFSGRMSDSSFKLGFLAISVAYFITATLSISKKSRI